MNSESRWFGLHHFESPIVRDYHDLILPAIKVLSKLYEPSQFVNEVYQLIQSVRTIVVGISEEIEEGNLTQHRRSIELKLKIQEEQREEQLLKLKEMRNQKQRKQNQNIFEQQHQETLQYITTLEKQMSQVDKQIAEVDTHALYLIDALFQLADRSLANEGPMPKLRDVVLSLNKQYHEQGHYKLPKQLGLKCLAYIPLLDFDQCTRILNIFVNILQASLNVAQGDKLNSDDPTLIVSLRCVLDCLLIYNFDEATEFCTEDNVIDKASVVAIISNLAIKSKGTLQCTALEGLAKLLLHQRIANPLVHVAMLLFLWFDKTLKEQHLQLQIVTTFFKCFITSSADHLLTFEKGLEVYTCVCSFLNSKPTLKLNLSYLQSGHWQEGQLLRNTMVGLKMLHYKTINGQVSFSQLRELIQSSPQLGNKFQLGPQESFIVFICKMVAEYNSLLLRTLLNDREYDFLAHYDPTGESDDKMAIEPGLLEIVARFVQGTIESLEEKHKPTQNENQLLKRIFNCLGTEVLSERSLSSVAPINAQFNDLKQHVNYLVKLMKDDKIIMEDARGQRDRELGELNAKQAGEASEDESDEVVNMSPKKRKKNESDESPRQVEASSPHGSDNEQVATKGRKKAIQKRKVQKGKK